MKYVNTKTGAESDQFSEADWKRGLPQRYGWIKNSEAGKIKPKDIIDAVFTKVKEKQLTTELVTDELPKPTPKKRTKKAKK